ncbi:uncharacterized protein VP01_446g2 [Puccinia sorghi]|uniref:Uncharacterized protein n=1 Tax=Puccinia sorghi TaxID=27349 RepID=A0A0L6URB7_9BASI|nr:uncharacterized protein VP01_446g2 [Puccinia sorghi]
MMVLGRGRNKLLQIKFRFVIGKIYLKKYFPEWKKFLLPITPGNFDGASGSLLPVGVVKVEFFISYFLSLTSTSIQSARVVKLRPIWHWMLTFLMNLLSVHMSTFAKIDQPSLQNKLTQLPAVDIAPEKLSSKIHLFAYVDVLEKSLCIWINKRCFLHLKKNFLNCLHSLMSLIIW